MQHGLGCLAAPESSDFLPLHGRSSPTGVNRIFIELRISPTILKQILSNWNKICSILRFEKFHVSAAVVKFENRYSKE